MRKRFPWLRDNDLPYWPPRRRCPVCGRPFVDTVVYIMAGALVPIQSTGRRARAERQMEGFFNVGVHTSDTECRGNADLEIVRDLKGGQFDLQFCSLDCLQEFFNFLVEQLRTESSKAMSRRGSPSGGRKVKTHVS
jgi:hypothetical protein